ncbi:MAG: hypothetical protein AB1806_01375 [Acidobacteriota bacterium]
MRRAVDPGLPGTTIVPAEDAGESRLRQGARTSARFLAVVVLLAGTLRGLDQLPGILTSLPRGATRVESLDRLERELGFAFPLPVDYPAELAWPPVELRLYPGPSAVAIVDAADTGSPALIVGTAGPGLLAVSPELLPPVTVLQASESAFGARRATVARVQDAGGALWHQATWSAHGRVVVVRYRGDVARLSRMVAGMTR